MRREDVKERGGRETEGEGEREKATERLIEKRPR